MSDVVAAVGLNIVCRQQQILSVQPVAPFQVCASCVAHHVAVADRKAICGLCVIYGGRVPNTLCRTVEYCSHCTVSALSGTALVAALCDNMKFDGDRL